MGGWEAGVWGSINTFTNIQVQVQFLKQNCGACQESPSRIFWRFLCLSHSPAGGLPPRPPGVPCPAVPAFLLPYRYLYICVCITRSIYLYKCTLISGINLSDRSSRLPPSGTRNFSLRGRVGGGGPGGGGCVLTLTPRRKVPLGSEARHAGASLQAQLGHLEETPEPGAAP